MTAVWGAALSRNPPTSDDLKDCGNFGLYLLGGSVAVLTEKKVANIQDDVTVITTNLFLVDGRMPSKGINF